MEKIRKGTEIEIRKKLKNPKTKSRIKKMREIKNQKIEKIRNEN